jgi:hypothetical protein
LGPPLPCLAMGTPSWATIRAPRRTKNETVPICGGDTGRVEIRPDDALWVPGKGKKVWLEGGLWGLAITPAGPVAFAVDGTPWMLRDGDFVAGPKPAGFTPRDRTTAGWDPTRKATVLMSGRPHKGKAKLKDTWAFDGTAMTKLAIEPPIRVVDGGASFSPALDAFVVAGGAETWKGAPAPTYEIRAGRSTSFAPSPFRWSMWLATDPASGLVVATGADKPGWGESWLAAVYLGSGKWQALPPTPKATRTTWFEPSTRTLHATVQDGPMRSEHACPIGERLDALTRRARP